MTTQTAELDIELVAVLRDAVRCRCAARLLGRAG